MELGRKRLGSRDAGEKPLGKPLRDRGLRQFTKAAKVLRGMRLSHQSKNEQALKELKDKGMEAT